MPGCAVAASPITLSFALYAFTGSLPPGVPTNAYGQVVALAAGPQSCVVIDSVAGLPLTVEAAKKVGCKAMLKVERPHYRRRTGGVNVQGYRKEKNMKSFLALWSAVV